MAQKLEENLDVKFLEGNHAAAEGALAAGMRFYAGYPITPSSEIAEYLARRLPEFEDGAFIQMEDEIASATACIGASYAGKKAMTATSGPGFALMIESFGLGIMTEAPFVIVNVQRAAPSTGQPTSVGQGDLMQARYGSHGDVEIIAVAPYSSQEMYDLTIRAFNLAEKYRVPVVILSDEKIAHLKEAVIMKNPEVYNREKPKDPPETYLPYKPGANMVPPIANFGEGYKVFATGLTHDEKGYPDMKPPAHISLIKRLNDKITSNIDDIADYEEFMLEDAEIAIVSFGISARCSKEAIEAARKEGIKVGMLRLKTIWPFADKVIQDLATKINKIIPVELNYGQITKEITRATKGIDCQINPLAQPQSEPYSIQQILDKINEIKDMPVATAKPAKRGLFNRH